MSDFSRFMKANKVKKEAVTYVATQSLLDEAGEPLPWTLKPITARENDALRDTNTVDIPIKGKTGMYRQKLNHSKYIASMICASVVEPNLNNAELQDSYGVKTPEDLLHELVDSPGEYVNLVTFVQKMNGFDISMDELVEQVKN